MLVGGRLFHPHLSTHQSVSSKNLGESHLWCILLLTTLDSIVFACIAVIIPLKAGYGKSFQELNVTLLYNIKKIICYKSHSLFKDIGQI